MEQVQMEDFTSNPNATATGMAVVESTLLTAGIAAASRAANLAKGGGPKYKKAPDAPKRFKSAFIIFSAEKHKEIKDDLIQQGRTEKTTDIAKLVSEAWREMPPDEKENWEKKARKDKARYEVEKSMYKGPWKVPANKRTPKDPSAPKRPMSAFLAFSNKRRAGLKREHPDATNADLSKMLSKTWREAPEELRKKYMDEEAGLRATYKVEVAKWRKKVAEERKQERTEREAVAMQAAEARAKEPPAMMMPNGGFGMNAVAPPTNDMNAGGLYGGGGGAGGNPYGMALGPGGGSFGGMPQDASQQYANLMNPFASAQPFMGNNQTQQQLLSQLFAGQQFKNHAMGGGGQNNSLGGMAWGAGPGGMGGGFTNPMGGGGYGGAASFNAPSGGMDMAATQRAMLEAAQNSGHTMTNGVAPTNFHPGYGNDWMNVQQHQPPPQMQQQQRKEDDASQQQQAYR